MNQTTSHPFFSVIIPVFNREATIGMTLESVAAQQFRDFECLVIDDGSSDRTCEIVRTFSFARLVMQQNAGPGSARNHGLRLAAGEYTAFIDSDDLWFPWSLKTYAAVIKKYDRPTFVTGRHFSFSNAAEIVHAPTENLRVEHFSDYFASSDRWRWHGVSSFVIRRAALLAAGGFAEGMINGEDAELIMRLGTSPGFIHVVEPLMFAYRTHPGNVTLDTAKSVQGLQLLLRQESAGMFPGGTARARERLTIISRHVRPMALSLAQRGDWAAAMKLYRQVLAESCRSVRIRFVMGLPLIAISGVLKKHLGNITRLITRGWSQADAYRIDS